MSRRPPCPSRPALLLGLALLAGASCRGPERRDEELVTSAIQHGRYAEALEEARRLAEANPRDERLRALHRDAQVAYVLDLGRAEVFHGDLTRALELFLQAEAIAPGHPTVESWIAKTKAQLAQEWLDRAAERTGPEHLDEAEQAFEKVLEYDPDNQPAIRGLSQLLLLKNYRAGMSKTYFDDGLASFRELLLQQAQRAFQVSNRYRANEPATVRGEQVKKLMAEDRLAQARSLETGGMFFAARNEYRLVLLIDPAHAEGRAGLDRMDRETRALRSISEADMEIRRGQLEEAEQTLDEAQALTVAQQDGVALLQSGIQEKRLEDMYLEARSLSDDYRYPEAVAAYERLLAATPEYKDAALRKATLEEFIRLAEEFYARAGEALAKSDDAVAEEYLRAIHPVIWPEYRDVVQLLEAIEARKAAREDAGQDEAPEKGGG